MTHFLRNKHRSFTFEYQLFLCPQMLHWILWLCWGSYWKTLIKMLKIWWCSVISRIELELGHRCWLTMEITQTMILNLQARGRYLIYIPFTLPLQPQSRFAVICLDAWFEVKICSSRKIKKIKSWKVTGSKSKLSSLFCGYRCQTQTRYKPGFLADCEQDARSLSLHTFNYSVLIQLVSALYVLLPYIQRKITHFIESSMLEITFKVQPSTQPT